MTITGTFTDNANRFQYDEWGQQEYRVTITDGTGKTFNIIDAEDLNDTNIDSTELFFFSPDPVHLTCERSDLTQLIIITQATIRLKVVDDVADMLFADTSRSISVTIERISEGHNHRIFYGFVDPLVFNQAFAYHVEEVEITATDPLGALNDLYIQDTDIGALDSVCMLDAISSICNALFVDDSSNFVGIKTYWNNSINPNSIKINASVLYGEDVDDRMSLYDSLNEILKYLGCTICYEPEGRYIHLFSLYYIGDNEELAKEEWFDGKENSMDASANISRDVAYNQVTLTCDIETLDESITFDDEDFLYSDYNAPQKFMTELISEGEGVDEFAGFIELTETPDGKEKSTSGNAYRKEHFCYVMRNDAWNFGNQYNYITYMGGTEGDDEHEPTPMSGDQSKVLAWLRQHPMKCALIGFDSSNKINTDDNSPISSVSPTPYFIISVQGIDDHHANGHINTLHNLMRMNSPLATYKGINSVNLVPTDSNVINYILISGKIILNPLQEKTGPSWTTHISKTYNTYADTKQWLNYIRTPNANFSDIVTSFTRTVPYNCSGDSAYYAQKWWELASGATETNPSYVVTTHEGVYDFLDNNKNQDLEYKYTKLDNNNVVETDEISKIPILVCQMKIGDKYCVERLDQGYSGMGLFEWMTQEEWQTEVAPKGFDVPYFTIGIDPKKNDKLIGVSHDIAQNVNYTMNIDGSGTAIPIKMSDGLNGQCEFSILGPAFFSWNDLQIYYAGVFLGGTKYKDNHKFPLEMIDSIMISDFSIDFKSNNGLVSDDKNNSDKDLIYMSPINSMYTDKLEQDLKICTPLTNTEYNELGIKYKISNSYVMTAGNEPFYGWEVSGRNKPLKPEELFVDYMYQQYNVPARILNINVNNGYVFGEPAYEGNNSTSGSYIGFSTILAKYLVDLNYPVIGKHDYFCLSMDWSLKYRDNNMSLRQKLAYDSPFHSH